MAGVLRISEAAILGLHAAQLLAQCGEEMLTAHEIAGALRCSSSHLVKVMQRLVRAGIANSTRGPHGGFCLAKLPSEISLLEVYEALEGRLPAAGCFFSRQVCAGPCMFGGLLSGINAQVHAYLTQTLLSQTQISVTWPANGEAGA